MFSSPAARRPGRDGAAKPRPGDAVTAGEPAVNPWHALWAMMIGFFMILVDATIVAVANPSIMENLGADYDAVIWVTSAYLLGYAVPLLLAGRLGDRFGPRNVYLAGLAVFTVASLWCGLAGSIEMLIAARVVQGVGAALLTPQTLSTITRIFPPERRGVAMSVWGATAGVATLVGPLAGGVLVDTLGWQWIFIVNVPVGVAGLLLAARFVPALPTRKNGFDIPGVLLSGLGMFLIVFALQEGQTHSWAAWIWGCVALGVGAIAGFVYWQAVTPHEPLIPLQIFRDRDFSLSNLGIATIGFVVTGMIVPLMFYAQAVCGLSPTRAALLTAPMAIATGVLAPLVGRIVDRSHPRPVVGFGFSALAIALTWLSIDMTPSTPIWRLVLPITLMGIGMAFIWSPLAATATRNLPPTLAGAGSGVYNATRQVGSVLGSAGMAAFMTSRIGAELPAARSAPVGEGAVTALPAFLHESFAAAMSQSILLPAFVALFGVVAALFLLGFGGRSERTPGAAGEVDAEARTEVMHAAAHGDDAYDAYDFDDDDYLEYTVEWDDPPPARPLPVHSAGDDDALTEPLASRVEHPLPAPAEVWHSHPVESWHSLLDDDEPGDTDPGTERESVPVPAETEPDPWRNILEALMADVPLEPSAQSNGFAHNGFHVDEEQRLQLLPQVEPPPVEPPAPSHDPFQTNGHSRHHHVEPPHPNGSAGNGRHYRDEHDEAPRGRHSRPS
jgi:EmrB/QacA subfamily drug resistance transporter